MRARAIRVPSIENAASGLAGGLAGPARQRGDEAPLPTGISTRDPLTAQRESIRKNSRSGVPVHFPIALQPSTQTRRVICVSCGSAYSRSSVHDRLSSTRPPISSR